MWRTAVVNFRGDPYEPRDGVWTKVRPVTLLENKILVPHFKQEVESSGSYLSAVMENEHSGTYSLLSQLAGTLDEQTSEGLLSQQNKWV